MLTYHKIFKANQSFYLSNSESVLSTNEGFLNRLTGAKNIEELHNAKVSILKDFRALYAFDAADAEFPEPTGHFTDNREKCEFVKKKFCCMILFFILEVCLKSTMASSIKHMEGCPRLSARN